jgi:hypothetical protein
MMLRLTLPTHDSLVLLILPIPDEKWLWIYTHVTEYTHAKWSCIHVHVVIFLCMWTCSTVHMALHTCVHAFRLNSLDPSVFPLPFQSLHWWPSTPPRKLYDEIGNTLVCPGPSQLALLGWSTISPSRLWQNSSIPVFPFPSNIGMSVPPPPVLCPVMKLATKLVHSSVHLPAFDDCLLLLGCSGQTWLNPMYSSSPVLCWSAKNLHCDDSI